MKKTLLTIIIAFSFVGYLNADESACPTQGQDIAALLTYENVNDLNQRCDAKGLNLAQLHNDIPSIIHFFNNTSTERFKELVDNGVDIQQLAKILVVENERIAEGFDKCEKDKKTYQVISGVYVMLNIGFVVFIGLEVLQERGII